MDGFHECILTVHSASSMDAYSFNFISDGTKTLEEFGQEIEIKADDILDANKLKQISACDLHEQLSRKITMFVKLDVVTGKYKCWPVIYLSTSKNRYIFRKNGKI